MSDDLIIITGASSGLGYSFAKIYANKFNNLLLIGRDEKKLELIADEISSEFNVKIYTVALDIANSNFIDPIHKIITENHLVPTMLINNAAVGLYGAFESQASSKINMIINLNITALTSLTKYIVNTMLGNSKRCKILNVSSTISFRKAPNWTVYAASKAYLNSFTRSLEVELKKTNISFSLLCSGKFNSKFDERAENLNPGSKKISSDSIASYAATEVEKGKSLIIPGMFNKIKYIIFKSLPDFITDRIIRSL